MYSRVIITALAFCLAVTSVAAQTDSTRFAALDAKLDEYLAALEKEPTDVKCSETDFIISASDDPEITARIARRVYSHYRDSRLMGDEAVAIHVFDTWFADGTLKMESDEDFFAAQFHASANRSSLIGCRAPSLTLLTPDNRPVTICQFSPADNASDDAAADRTDGRYGILYFYDVGCPKCLVETVILRNILESHDWDLVLYAVYVGSDTDRWADYRAERFPSDPDRVRIVHLYDPDLSSGFALSYGVIGTPKMFLIDPDGIIVGRELDGAALEKLLSAALDPPVADYGSDESAALYDRTFADADPSDCGAVSAVASRLASMLLPPDAVTPSSSEHTTTLGNGPQTGLRLYKQMTGDLLYYITGRREAGFKCGAGPFIDDYILSRPDVWSTADDTLKVVNLALFLKDLLNLCPVGEPLPSVQVPATVLTRRSDKTGEVRLDRLKNCVIIFHTEGCPVCQAETAAARNLLSSKSTVSGTDLVPSKIVLIDMDEIWSGGGSLPETLMSRFDLSSLPFILCLDRTGAVSRKYLSLQ